MTDCTTESYSGVAAMVVPLQFARLPQQILELQPLHRALDQPQKLLSIYPALPGHLR
jgi:hypothetical protein